MSPPAVTPAWLEAAAAGNLPDLDGENVPLSAPIATAKAKSRLPAEIVIEPAPEPKVETPPVDDTPKSEKPKRRVAPLVELPVTDEEVELSWRGYHPITLLPGFVVAAAVTAGVLVYLRALVPVRFVHECVDAPLAALWLGQFVRLGYRAIAYEYRLTNRRLFRSRGPLYPADAPVDLGRVANVQVRRGVFGWLLGVGTVRVECEDSAEVPPLELAGVPRPRALAALVEKAAEAARNGNVTAAKVTAGV
ncbi:MAG: PH domain-containing protein [Gemmataceae bacterium]